MSEHAHHEDDHEEHHHSVGFYTGIAVFLAVLTFIELGPLFEWFNLPVPALLVLSVVKFAVVVGIFMHLAEDAGVFANIFTPALLGAVAMVFVLMLLAFSIFPSPRGDLEPIEERHWTNYSGECQSWLRSHVSNRWYCASPEIEQKRLVAFASPVGGGAPAGGTDAPDLSGMSDDEVKQTLASDGEGLYGQHCVACHQQSGAGIPGVFPPLAGSDYIDDPARHAEIIVHGLNGEIVVNGTTYNGAMTAFKQLSDYEIAAIATYERNAWGNEMGIVTPEIVASAR